MLPVALDLGFVRIYSWGLMLACAFLACWVAARWYLARRDLDGGMAVDLVLAAALGGIAGARLLHVASDWPRYAADPLSILLIQRGGMVFYGGLAGGAAGVLGYVLWRRLPIAVIADGAAITVPLGSAIGRLGCFLNGCCGGRETSAWWGIAFRGSSVRVVPTQLIDSAANVLIFAAIMHVAVRREPRPGTLWWVFLTLYGGWRFLIEFLRVNPPAAFGLTQAQLISLPVFFAGCAGLAWSALRSSREEGGADA